MNLKSTTRKLLRFPHMHLAQRYRVDRMFETPLLRCKMATDTMDYIYQSIHANQYFQVFVNKYFFVKGININKKSDCDKALSKLIHDFGSPDEMTMDGSKKQTGRNSKFQKLLKNHDISYRVCEP